MQKSEADLTLFHRAVRFFIGGDSLKKAIFRYIEAELYDYPFTKEEIEALRDSIIEATPGIDEANGRSRKPKYKYGNPTYTKTGQLLTNRRLRHMVETVTAKEKVLARLPKEKHKLVELKYWDCRLKHKGIAEALHVSEATYYRWRSDIVKAVAVEMGLVNASQAS